MYLFWYGPKRSKECLSILSLHISKLSRVGWNFHSSIFIHFGGSLAGSDGTLIERCIPLKQAYILHGLRRLAGKPKPFGQQGASLRCGLPRPLGEAQSPDSA